MSKSRWFFPGLMAALGAVALAAQLISGHAGAGIFDLALAWAAGAAVACGGRSETIRGLRGDGSDEGFRAIDMHATGRLEPD